MAAVAEIRLPRLHNGQLAVLRSSARYRWLAAGRRWRKTSLLMCQAVEQALRGRQILWAAPIYKQAMIGWEEMQRAAHGVATFTASQMTAQFPGGGRVLFRSLEAAANVRGLTADGIVVDEAASVDEAAWYEVLRPIISDTHGWAILTGTPRGRNWFGRGWEQAQTFPDAASWQAPTLGAEIRGRDLVRVPHPLENPEFPWAQLVADWAAMPETTFRQEYLAEFLVRSGTVFDCVTPATYTSHEIDVSGVEPLEIGA